MATPYVKLQATRGSTPVLDVPVVKADGSPETGLGSMALTFTMRRDPRDRDPRSVVRTNAAGITVGTSPDYSPNSHVASIALTRANLELGEPNRSTVLFWDLFAVNGSDRVPLVRGELLVLATASEYP